MTYSALGSEISWADGELATGSEEEAVVVGGLVIALEADTVGIASGAWSGDGVFDRSADTCGTIVDTIGCDLLDDSVDELSASLDRIVSTRSEVRWLQGNLLTSS